MASGTEGSAGPSADDRDVFICHASEDKDAIARPLAEELRRRGHAVWFDEFELTLGDSLRRSIDRGLTGCRFGVVVLSPSFLAKEWPQLELDSLTTREVAGSTKVILPVWHEVNHAYVTRFSPLLAGKLAVQSDVGIPAIVTQIERVLRGPDNHDSAGHSRAQAAPGGGDTHRDSEQDAAAQELLIPIDRFDPVKPPASPTAWAENALFTVGCPPGWHDTTPTESTIEGNPALVVLRRDKTTGLPGDTASRGVIRCFSSGRTTQGEFFAAAETLADNRARALQARLVGPLRFMRAGGALCYSLQVEGSIEIKAFQSIPSAITEVHMFHEGEWLMMQLESDPKFHAAYQQDLATVLGTLSWR